MKSAIYTGSVIHTRLKPKKHRFCYKLQMLYLDLDEIGSIFKKIPIWRDDGKKSLAYFKREDYISPHNQTIKKVIQKCIYEDTGDRHDGPIKILTNLRMFGFCFNPVSFYYCFDSTDTRLEFVVAQINNTPWNERHHYVIDVRYVDNYEFVLFERFKSLRRRMLQCCV